MNSIVFDDLANISGLFPKELAVEMGDRIKFKSEKQSYVVRARNNRFIICTKPFNARKTYIYCIIDLCEEVRGPDNFIGGKYCYEDHSDLLKAIRELELGELQVSHRRRLALDVEKVIPDTDHERVKRIIKKASRRKL
jgi:hypothetical protein